MAKQIIRVGTFISVLIFSSEVALTLFAQDNDSIEYFEMVDVAPTFRGTADYNEFLKYFASELKYPTEAIRDSFEGRVIFQFIVDSTGSVMKPNFLDSVPEYIKTEIERVLSISPKWTPGLDDGKPVNVIYSMPVTFSRDILNGNEESKKQSSNEKGNKRKKKYR